MAGKILVGTSSWADPGFVKEWYPPKMAARERLPWYSQRFRYVELNSSFYAVPDRNTVHKWVEETPDGFVFDVKAHRLLSRHSAQVESLPPELREQAHELGVDDHDRPVRPDRKRVREGILGDVQVGHALHVERVVDLPLEHPDSGQLVLAELHRRAERHRAQRSLVAERDQPAHDVVEVGHLRQRRRGRPVGGVLVSAR